MSAVYPLGALILATALLTLGHGMLNTLIPLRLGAEGASAGTIGYVGTAYFGGFIVGAWYCGAAIMRVGHIRAFAGFAALLAATALIMPLVPQAYVWLALRMVYGFAIAGLIMAIESWFAAASPKEWRGRILGIYMAVFYASSGGGQFLLNVYEVRSYELFSLATIIVSLSIIPIALSQVSAPRTERKTALSPRKLFEISPLAVVGCVGAGLLLGPFYGLAPLYFAQSGFSTSGVTTAMAVAIFGGLLAQWPIGYLSDRFDRRRVLIAVIALVGVVSLAMIALADSAAWLPSALIALFGAAAFTIYPVSVGHAADRLSGDFDMVQVASGLLLVYGVAATIGPLIAGQAFPLAGNRGLFIYFTVVAVLLVAFGVFRMTRRAPVPSAEQGKPIIVPSSTPQVFRLEPRATPAGSD